MEHSLNRTEGSRCGTAAGGVWTAKREIRTLDLRITSALLYH